MILVCGGYIVVQLLKAPSNKTREEKILHFIIL